MESARAKRPRPLPQAPSPSHMVVSPRRQDAPRRSPNRPRRSPTFANRLLPVLQDAPRRPPTFANRLLPVPLEAAVPRLPSLSKPQKEMNVFRFLQESEGMCILHLLCGGDASHQLFKCTMYATFSSLYLPLRSAIRFSTPGICYRCCVLTSDRFDHPFRSKDKNEPCRFDDILKPLCFAIYFVPSLRDIVLPEAGVDPQQFPSGRDYAKWLGNVLPNFESMYNMWEVCLAYVRLRDNNRFVHVHHSCVIYSHFFLSGSLSFLSTTSFRTSPSTSLVISSVVSRHPVGTSLDLN